MGSLLSIVLYSPEISYVVFLVKDRFNGRLVAKERKCKHCSSLDLSSPRRHLEFWIVLPLLESSDHKKMCRNFSLTVRVYAPYVM